ncbi:MAG: hypothetical protein QOI26_2142 [Pseudonocardiales bacterium]|nr:hypothetical protein [Pseudonocardiales bacterium]
MTTMRGIGVLVHDDLLQAHAINRAVSCRRLAPPCYVGHELLHESPALGGQQRFGSSAHSHAGVEAVQAAEHLPFGVPDVVS